MWAMCDLDLCAAVAVSIRGDRCHKVGASLMKQSPNEIILIPTPIEKRNPYLFPFLLSFPCHLFH